MSGFYKSEYSIREEETRLEFCKKVEVDGSCFPKCAESSGLDSLVVMGSRYLILLVSSKKGVMAEGVDLGKEVLKPQALRDGSEDDVFYRYSLISQEMSSRLQDERRKEDLGGFIGVFPAHDFSKIEKKRHGNEENQEQRLEEDNTTKVQNGQLAHGERDAQNRWWLLVDSEESEFRCEEWDVKEGEGQLEEVSDCCHNLHAVENLHLEREGETKMGSINKAINRSLGSSRVVYWEVVTTGVQEGTISGFEARGRDGQTDADDSIVSCGEIKINYCI
ncbi:hypothetical protein Acr_15g0012430 [Actinidia rufa]|uniref:Uncharacterized protein n=1 Tax=Actinidia rufa TaxID=165716 RepID=A0A7J0FVC8_9ERIC|nr:hypothetical protein Acr_15g0012430 [Actinidia rufa]